MTKKKHKGPRKGKPANSPRPKNYTSLGGHKKVGNVLHTGLTEYENFVPQSWSNDRLPEMLWAILLVTRLQRDEALEIFRTVARLGSLFEAPDDRSDVFLSAIAKWPSPIVDEFIKTIASDDRARAALRPLLLFENIPGRTHWEKHLDPADPEVDYGALASSVGCTFWHQSEEATDCRWVRLMFQISTGRMKFPPQFRDRLHELNGYPNVGEIRAVRPSVRSMEGVIDTLNAPGDRAWPTGFWKQCHGETICLRPDSSNDAPPSAVNILERVHITYAALAGHAVESETTTAIDAKHNAIFGAALLAVALLGELSRAGNASAVIGRVGLRMLTELYITLAYMVKEDNTELWESFRGYGMEQAKLAFLKLDELGGNRSFTSVEALREIANEDAWQEFLPIRLGHWAELNARTMSVEAGVKEDYDRYYGWPSTYAHGQWGAMRDSMFETCVNPLHRLHRIPRQRPRKLEDVLPSACEIADKILGLVDAAYPDFKPRISTPQPPA